MQQNGHPESNARRNGDQVQAGGDDAGSRGPLLLADLTSPGFAAALNQIEAVLIPVGAHEQHGPALPVSTDAMSAQVLSALTSTLLAPRVAVAPVIPWGVSWHHMEFPGTIALREDTLISLVMDVVGSLHQHGVKRFVLVNIHGGNNAALQVAAERSHRELGIPVVVPVFAYTLIANAARDVLGDEAIGHAGGDETSVVKAIRPELVMQEALGPRVVNEQLRRAQTIVRAAGGTLPASQAAISESGATGDSSAASAEAGSAILGQATNQLRAIVEEILDLELSAFGS
jgi:creatinine amidohydrolase